MTNKTEAVAQCSPRKLVEECARQVKLHADAAREYHVTIGWEGINAIGEALLTRFDHDGFGICSSPAENDAERISELQYEAGMYQSLYELWEKRANEYHDKLIEALNQVESATAWLDQEIMRAADQQRQSYAMSGEHGQRQGECWHARQIALHEAKLKFTSTNRAEST